MAIYAECPKCHRKQSLKNTRCRALVKGKISGARKLCNYDLHGGRKKNQVGYWVYLRYRGKQVWERIGPNLTMAREQEARTRAQLVDDEYRSAVDKRTKLKDFFEKDFLPWAKREKKTWEKDQRNFKIHILKYFGEHIKFQDIAVEHVEAFKGFRLSEKAKPATVNKDLALLKTIYNKAAKWGKYRGQNPVSLAGLLPERNEHVAQFLSEENANKLLNALPAETRPIFEFCLATGIRIGNVLNLRWDQIDTANRIIRSTTASIRLGA